MPKKRKGPKPRDNFRAFWLIHYKHDGLEYTSQGKQFIRELWAAVKAWQCKDAIRTDGQKKKQQLH